MKAHADQMKQAKDYKDLMAINHWGVERLPELERSKSQQMFPFSKANRKYNNTQNTQTTFTSFADLDDSVNFYDGRFRPFKVNWASKDNIAQQHFNTVDQDFKNESYLASNLFGSEMRRPPCKGKYHYSDPERCRCAREAYFEHPNKVNILTNKKVDIAFTGQH